MGSRRLARLAAHTWILMRAKRKVLLLASFLLLGFGIYFILSGARELVWPWYHQKKVARTWPPQSVPAPQTQTPPAPKRLDHSLFHTGDTVAKLTIPRLKGQWFVVEGTEDNSLRLGPGHLEGTAFPGETGNCVIAGHRDTQFRSLKDIKKGDEIVLTTSIGESRYRVTGWDIVKPTDTRSLDDTPNAMLNLVTCYPFYYVGNAPKRFIVHAEMVGREVADSGQVEAAKK
jgi:sortase A